MRHVKDLSTADFADLPTLELTDLPTFDLPEIPMDMEEVTPVYRQWGFWVLLTASIVLSFISGALVKTGGHLFG